MLVLDDDDLRDFDALLETLRSPPFLLRFSTGLGSFNKDVRQLYVRTDRLDDVRIAQKRSQSELARRAV